MKTNFKFLLILLFAGFLLPNIGNSQISFYTFSESTGNTFSSIASTGTSVTLTDDASVQKAIGFNFSYNSTNYSQLQIGSNGWIKLGTGSASVANNANLFSTSSSYHNVIAPFWDDLNPAASGNIYYEVQGTSPNRKLVIEYDSVQRYGSSNSGVIISVQAVLYETSNNIEFRYGASAGTFSSASIGINESPGGSAHYICVTPGTPATASSTTSNLTITAAPASGVNYLFTFTPPSCMPANTPTITGLTTTGVQLNWGSGGATNFNIEYGPSGFTQGTGTMVSVATDTFKVLTNLSIATAYDWYVQDSCGVGDVSTWNGPNTFTTYCNTVSSFPWAESFENSFNFSCWTNTGTSTHIWETNSGSSHGPGSVTDGSMAAMFNVYSASRGKTATMITPIFNLANLTSPVLTFDYWMNGGADVDLWIKVEQSNDGVTWTSIFNKVQDGTISAWTAVNLQLTGVSATTQFRFVAKSDYGSYNIFVDNIILYEPVANDLALLSINNLYSSIANVSDSINISVYNNGTQAQDTIPVAYSADGGNTYVVDTIFSSIASGDTLDFTFATPLNLSTGVNTIMAVVNNNDPAALNDTATFSITNWAIPYIEGFESGTASSILDGWSKIFISSSSYAYTKIINGTSSAHTGSKSIALYNSGDATGTIMSILPKYYGGFSQAIMKFWVKESGAHDLYIGVLSDPTDASTFVAVDTITTASSYNQYTVSFANYNGNGKFIAFKHAMASTYDTYYIDDVELFVPLANDMKILSIDGLESAVIMDSTSIVLSVYNNGTQAQDTIPVSYSIDGGSSFVVDTIFSTIAPTDTLQHTFAGKVVFPYGAVSVMGVVNNNDAAPINDTAIANIHNWQFPYLENYSTFVPEAWSLAKGVLGNTISTTGSVSYWMADGFGNIGTTGAARMNIYSTNRNEWLCSPSINLATGGNYVLKFNLALTDYTGTGTDNMGPDDTLAVVISTNNGLTWSISDTLQIWTANSVKPSTTGNTFTYDLSSYSNKIKIGFYASSSVSNTDYNVYIDNFKIGMLPVANLGNDTTICQNTNITLGQTAAYGNTYLWTANNDTVAATTSTITTDSAATYTIEVSSIMGSAFDTVNVSLHASTAVSFTGLANSYCSNASSVSLSGLPTGGTFSGNGVSANSFDPAQAGNGQQIVSYSITDNNGCLNTANDTTIITLTPVVKVSDDDTICAGDSIVLHSTPIHGVFFSMYIEGSGNNKAIEIYNATSDTINLDEYLIATNYNGGNWTSTNYNFPAGAKLPNGEVYVIANQSADPAILAVTDDTLAYNQGGYVVGFNGDDVRALFHKTSATDSVMIDIIGLYNHVDPGKGWDVAGVTNATKDHTLIRKPSIVKGDTSWTTIAGTDSVSSQYFVFPKNTFTGLGMHTLVNTDTYVWSTSATTSSIVVKPTATTTYVVTVTNANCSDMDSVEVTVNPLPVVNLGADKSFKWTNGSVTVDAGNPNAAWVWSTGQTTQTVTYNKTNLTNSSVNTISVVVTENNCKASDTIVITVINDVSINEHLNNMNLKIYPNPNKGSFVLEIDGYKGDFRMDIINLSGQIVFTENFAATDNFSTNVNVNTLAKGVYYVRLQTKEGSKINKLIIK